MTGSFEWRHWGSARSSEPADVVAAIDAVGRELGPDADVEAVLSALRARGLGFIRAIMGLMAITGVPLRDAKWMVHASAAYGEGRQAREDGWAAMYEEVANAPDVRIEVADDGRVGEDPPPGGGPQQVSRS